MVSRLSSGVNGGRIVGSRRESIVLPEPGEPSMIVLWTISHAREFRQIAQTFLKCCVFKRSIPAAAHRQRKPKNSVASMFNSPEMRLE